MFIDGIKALPNDGNDAIVWRFRYDRGIHRNICVIHATPADQDLLRSALRYAVFGLHTPRIKAATVQISDNNGDTWVFERQAEQFRCFKNRQFFDGRLETCLNAVFKDYRSSDDKLDPHHMMRDYDLNFDGQTLSALPSHASHRLSPWERAGRERIQFNERVLEQSLGLGKQLSRGQLEQLLGYGDGLCRKQFALVQQQREIEKVFGQLQQLDHRLAAKLEQETELLQKIANLAEPLLDPSKNPRILAERLKEVTAELEELCTKWGVQQLPQPEIQVDWGQALQVLTRSLACENLEKSARKSLHDAKHMLRPVYDSYRQSIRGFLELDQELIKELEACLSELKQHVHLATAEQEKNKDNLASKLNKLLNLGQLEQGASNLGPQTLEQSRQAVNQCLHLIGQLYGELEQNREIHDQQLAELEQRYEKILADANKAREQWQVICQQLGLPLDTSLKSLVNGMNHYSKISILHQRRLRLEEEIQEFRQQGRALAKLLEEWRTLTGSQKSTRLDQLTMVLAEARGVLQYADKKKAQLLKLQALGSKLEAYQQMKGKVEADLSLIQRRWEQVLDHLEIARKPFDGGQWEKMAQALRENLLLDQLLSDANKPLKNEQIFAAEALDAALTFYVWKENAQGNKARLQILQHVEYADDAGMAFILTTDEALVELLLKIGVGRGQRVETKSEPSVPPATAPGKAQKPLISEKARAALEVFAAKQSGGSRNSL